jgi:hypothetical protein
LIIVTLFVAAENVTREDLISTYKASCEKHGTSPIQQLLKQLEVSGYHTYLSDINVKGKPG